MFESVDADEAALVEEISRLERVKSAAAAGQARAAAALDEVRRAEPGSGRGAGGPAGSWGGGAGGVGAAGVAAPGPAAPGSGEGADPGDAAHPGRSSGPGGSRSGRRRCWRARPRAWSSQTGGGSTRRLTGDPEARLETLDLARGESGSLGGGLSAVGCRAGPGCGGRSAPASAESQRRVSLRPAPDTMSQLSALLPVAQGVAVYAALVAVGGHGPGGR